MAATKNARDIFLAATERTPAERAAYLDEACAGDAALRQRVEALLRAHDEPGAFLSEAPADASATAAVIPTLVGTVIAGRYKLLEAIGEGGMGTVWVAEQTQPVRRRVALKLIKAGMDSKSVLARFEAERQALAVMDHRNIAKVLDGGLTEMGRPFFVMEYVKGVPITEYCDATRLSVPQRLNLFVQVCPAVQHAHQKGIIHRDLKLTRAKLGPEHPNALIFMGNLASAYDELKQFDKAELLFREELRLMKQKSGVVSPAYAGALASLGLNLLHQKKWRDAEPLLRECLAIREKNQPDAWRTYNTKSLLGGALLGQKKYADAEPLLLAGYAGMKQREAKIPATPKARLTEALERLVQLYEAMDKKDAAAMWRKELDATKTAQRKVGKK